MTSTSGGVELPANQQTGIETLDEPSASEPIAESVVSAPPAQSTTAPQGHAASVESVGRPETPSTQDLPSESALSTSPTTPASVHTTQTSTIASITPTQALKSSSKTAIPAVPVVPILPKSSPKETRTVAGMEKSELDSKQAIESTPEQSVDGATDSAAPHAPDTKPEPAPVPVKTAPKSWASLLAKNPSTATDTVAATRNSPAASAVNGTIATDGAFGGDAASLAGFAKSNASSQAEALHNFQVSSGSKLAFLEPRGLINTGNMCYMNSVSRPGFFYFVFHILIHSSRCFKF
jgi:ubiquitin carboxyl-terminal hydrolase 10